MPLIDSDELRNRYIYHAKCKAEKDINRIIGELKHYEEAADHHSSWELINYADIDTTWYKCKNCHRIAGTKLFKYCPNCGARMDKEVSNE